MKNYIALILTLVTQHSFGEITLFYNHYGELTIKELASHYRQCDIDVNNKKFKGQVNEFDLDGTKFLELNYDSNGVKNGNFEYKRFGASFKGIFKNNVPKFSLPDSIMKQIIDKEKFIQAAYIRKNDYNEIKTILTPFSQSPDSVLVNGEVVYEVFTLVEKMPTFPGGMTALSNFLSYYLVYPKQALDNGVKGKVLVEFTIMKDGTIGKTRVREGIGHGCDEAAQFAVSKLPDWNPGYQSGKPVLVRMTLPIQFH